MAVKGAVNYVKEVQNSLAETEYCNKNIDYYNRY
jgi:hypothetical protein